MPNLRRGFSLLTALLTLALVAIFLTIALPSYQHVVLETRRAQRVNVLVHAVHLARTEARVRNSSVVVCPTLDTHSCEASTDWSGGWIVFVNDDRDWPAVRDADEPILFSVRFDHGQVNSNRRAFRFGRRGSTNGTLIVCDRRGPVAARAVIVSQLGRPRLDRRRADGSPLICAVRAPYAADLTADRADPTARLKIVRNHIISPYISTHDQVRPKRLLADRAARDDRGGVFSHRGRGTELHDYG